MGALSNLTVYGRKWNLVSSESLTSEEKKAVHRAFVTKSDFGLAVCLMMANGTHYIPLSNNCKAQVQAGDNVDVENLRIETLEREGDSDIYRANILE